MAPSYIQQTQLSGTRNGEDWPGIGHVIDLPASEAAGYVAAGYVAPVPTLAEEIETAVTSEKVQTATQPRGRKSTKAVIAEAEAARAVEAEAAATAAAEAEAQAEAAALAEAGAEAGADDAAAGEGAPATSAETPAAD